MSCDRVVIAQTSSQGGKTTVTWLKYDMTGLAGYLILLVQNGTPTAFDAKATDTSVTVNYTATSTCMATVTPKNADGPVNDKVSFAAPVPFPATPIDPDSNRPTVIRACADATTVTVNWIPSTLPGLLGNYLSIIQNFTDMTNFQVDGGAIAVYTAEYTVQSGSSYQVIVTPYDKFGLDYRAASYPAPIPYPS